MSKKKSKKPKKKEKFTLGGFAKEFAKEFEVSVMSENTADQTPYYINFKHKALQKNTGGCPGGRVTEFIGISQTGKSFLLYELISSVLGMGGYALLDDPECAYEPRYGRKVGITGNKKFLYTKNNMLEKFFKLAKKFVLEIRKTDKISPILIGMDSYPAMDIKVTLKDLEELPKDEVKGFRHAQKNNVLSCLIGEFTRFLDKHNATFVMVNQGKKKIGVMFGDERTSNADNIMQYFATLRLWGKLGARINEKIPGTKNKKKQIGVISEWETLKNRNIPPHKKCITEILYKDGVKPLSGFAELLIEEGLIVAQKKKKDKPRTYKYGKKKYTLKKLLKKHPKLLEPVQWGE